MSLGSDGLYLIEQSYLNKYDLNGDRVWTVQLEAGVGAETIAADSTGIFVAGFADHPLTNQSFAGAVLFARQYDSSGNLVWTSEFSNVNLTGVSFDVFAGPSGVYVVYWNGYGPYLVKYDLNGIQLWNYRLPILGISAITGDLSGLYLTGTGDSYQGYLGKYDFNGNLDWSVQYASPDSLGVGDSNAVLDSSGLYFCMSSIAGHEFLMKYDLSGNKIWSFQMPQSPGADLPADQTAFHLATSSGIVYVAGSVSDRSGHLSSEAMVVGVSSSASLFLFGVNPPWSFFLLGGIVTTVAVGLFYFRKRSRTRSRRVRPSERALPVND
jgi:hypothetical protein